MHATVSGSRGLVESLEPPRSSVERNRSSSGMSMSMKNEYPTEGKSDQQSFCGEALM